MGGDEPKEAVTGLRVMAKWVVGVQGVSWSPSHRGLQLTAVCQAQDRFSGGPGRCDHMRTGMNTDKWMGAVGHRGRS